MSEINNTRCKGNVDRHTSATIEIPYTNRTSLHRRVYSNLRNHNSKVAAEMPDKHKIDSGTTCGEY